MSILSRRFFLFGTAAVAVALSVPKIIQPVWVNVVDFGADPTGLRDSTEAFRKAIDAVSPDGGTVYVPSETYKAALFGPLDGRVSVVGG